MKRFYQQELEDLRTKLILIGQKVNEASRIAIEGLLENDLEKLTQAVVMDNAIDQLEAEIDQASVRYITLRAPVSMDVRFILVAIKASHDLERAGDEAEKIALQSKKILTKDGVSGETATISEMAEIASSMMQDAITALIEEDVELAQEVITRDKKVNQLNKDNFKYFSVGPESDKTENATHFQKIFISKSIERIADHAKNLAEEVIYLLTGTHTLD
jgi:phosphate transport system protein